MGLKRVCGDVGWNKSAITVRVSSLYSVSLTVGS